MKDIHKLFIAALLFVLGLSFAQEEARAPLASEPLFAKLIGTWEGEGWTMLGPNERAEFKQTELVEAKANGHAITVEGLGKDKESGELVFQAFGVFSYDAEKDAYVLTTFQTEGYSITMNPEVTDDGFIWGFDVPQGTVRYTATLTDTSWTEIGEFSPDGGETWFQTFEMNLTKVR